MIVFTLDKLLAIRKMNSIELAERLGCTPQTISKIKTGKVRSFRVETIDGLCKIFECQPNDIMEYVDDDVAIERFGVAYFNAYRDFYKNV